MQAPENGQSAYQLRHVVMCRGRLGVRCSMAELCLLVHATKTVCRQRTSMAIKDCAHLTVCIARGAFARRLVRRASSPQCCCRALFGKTRNTHAHTHTQWGQTTPPRGLRPMDLPLNTTLQNARHDKQTADALSPAGCCCSELERGSAALVGVHVGAGINLVGQRLDVYVKALLDCVEHL